MMKKQGAEKDTNTEKTPMAPLQPATNPVLERMCFIDTEPKTLFLDELILPGSFLPFSICFLLNLFIYLSLPYSFKPVFNSHFLKILVNLILISAGGCPQDHQ
jgi:hypothetical protein